MNNKQRITKALIRYVGGAQMITLAEFTSFMNRKDLYKAKHKYLENIGAVDGKYYLIDDVAEALDSKMSI